MCFVFPLIYLIGCKVTKKNGPPNNQTNVFSNIVELYSHGSTVTYLIFLVENIDKKGD